MITQHRIDDEMKDSMRAPWIAAGFVAIAREIGVPEAESFVLGWSSNLARVCWRYG